MTFIPQNLGEIPPEVAQFIKKQKAKAEFEIEKGFIDLVCSLTSDEYTLKLARFFEMSPNGQARKHLDHYLKGTALNLYVDLKKVFRDDNGVRIKVQQEIKDGLRLGKRSGSIKIPQKVYLNKDWHYAIGGMNITWEVLSADKIHCSFKNQYRWHPDDRRRTQCVHQAAVNLQTKIYARDYWMYGATVIYIREL